MNKKMLRNYYLFLFLLITVAVGNIQIEGKTRSVISRTMKEVIWNIAREKGDIPERFGSALGLIEAITNDPGIYKDIPSEIQGVLHEREHRGNLMAPPDMPSGRELHSIYRLMVDSGMIYEYEQRDVQEVMQYIPINEWEFGQITPEVRKKIYAIYQIARSSDPEKLVTALLKNSNLTVIPNARYNAKQPDPDKAFYPKTTFMNRYERRPCLVPESSGGTGENLQSWARTFGAALNDGAYSIQQTSDGGYIVAGFASFLVGPTGNDFWILKLSPSGEIEWQRAYAGSKSDIAYSISQTADGGYIVAGSMDFSDIRSSDFWILKLDSTGNAEWQKTYGGSDSDTARSIQQTADGGYIVTGSKRYSGPGSGDFWVLKLSPSGDIEWQKAYAGSNSDRATSIQQTIDGGYITAGPTNSFGAGNYDSWILKLSSGGDVEWQRTYGGSDSDAAYSIQQTSDGGYITAGYTNSFGAGSNDFWVLKLSSSGDIEWQKAYGGRDSEVALSIRQTVDGGYIIAGSTNSFGAGSNDFWILKLSSSGDIEWQKAYGGIRFDTAQSIQQTSDGGYIVAGITESFGFGWYMRGDFLVLKLDSNGDIKKLPELTGISKASVSDTSVYPQDTFIFPQDTDVIAQEISIVPPETTRGTGILLFGPPSNIKGEKVLNRSLSQEEYINVLSWEPNPNNEDFNIVKYRIYRVINGEDYLLTELNASSFEYWHRNVWKGKEYIYYIVAVNDADLESIAAYITVQ